MDPKLEHPELDYSDDDPANMSSDAPVPRWLIFNYIFWPVWGIAVFFLYWNGSHGWLDRGYWQELQRAANTVYPFNTLEKVEKEAAESAREAAEK